MKRKANDLEKLGPKEKCRLGNGNIRNVGIEAAKTFS
jgi:hypothetical protein